MQNSSSSPVVSITQEAIDPCLIFECGQAFRFNKVSRDTYFGVVEGRVLFVRKTKEGMDLYPVMRRDMEFWREYFDLGSSYRKIIRSFPKKSVLKEAVREFPGLRLLNQPPFETLITFIISANNNIKRIKGIVEKLCAAAGQPIEQEKGSASFHFRRRKRWPI